MRPLLWALSSSAFLLAGCPTASSEPPPPVRKAEIPTAPPRALGALAAGTDAAPKPDLMLPEGLAEPDVPSTPPSAPGPAPDGSGSAPEPPAATAPPRPPDAGMAL